MSTKVMFLHLSDIHIENKSDEILNRAHQIAASTFQRLPEVQALIFIFSGDIAWSGVDHEYELAERFINEIRFAIQKENDNVKIEVFMCPGNHDCDFSQHDDTREAVLSRIRTLGDDPLSESLIKTASSLQNNFHKFRNKISQHKWQSDTRLSWQTNIEIGNLEIGIRCLNVAWMSELKEKQGTLYFPPEAIKPFVFSKKSNLSVTVLHHPFNWFGQSSYREFQSVVRRESQFVFTGHEHFQNVNEISDRRNSQSVFIEGGVLYEKKEPSQSTFNVVIVDLTSGKYLTEFYNWDGKNYLATIENEDWNSLRALPEKGQPSYALNNDFSGLLKDPGANFSHSAKKNLTIDDIFVWPELQCTDDPGLIKRQVSGSHLEDISNIESGAIIRGGEKHGKTTLLRQYFSSFYERGYLPVYFKGNWFTKTHQIEHLKALSFALEKQYKKANHQRWLQEPRSKKVLLLDDIDSCRLAPDMLSKCLKGLFEYFSAIILTAKDGAAAMDLLSIDRVEALGHFKQYEIREFGYKKRFELVCKWAELGDHGGDSSDKWMTTIDKWEKDLTTAVGHQFVPAVPLFLLTLLQSIEAGRTADLQNSAFGHYYQFLITSSLQNTGIERDQWSEVINYCANLAWLAHSSEKKNFTENELKNFNDSYSKEFTPIIFERRIRELLEAGILARVDGDLEFKYPYLCYYFLGQYLSDRIHDPEIEQVITCLCENLYLRDNANIILFTSHHTKSPVIYEKIIAALEQCFADEPTFDFEQDVTLLNQLVDKAPQLVYHEEPTKVSRSRIREQEDESTVDSESNDPGVDAEPYAAITRLFRGMEILGQFLKNHYGTTRNPAKDELIDKLWQSALRGLHGTTILLIENPVALANHIERLLSERRPGLPPDELKARARRIVFDIVGMITYGFIQKAGACVGSAYLKDNLKNVVQSKGTLAYSLIEMSYQLDLPEQIPFNALKYLNKTLEHNVFSRELLRTMALRHLHLFKVSYKDKQKICSELSITLNKQLALQHERDGKIT